MGFDYGQRRIGVAVAQTLTGQARALSTLGAVKQAPDWDGIAGLIAEWSPQRLVVGLPLNRDGSEHQVTRAARRFGNRLSQRHRLPVQWIDERLSSHEASARLAAASDATPAPVGGARGRGRSVRGRSVRGRGGSRGLDAEAACVILETWLADYSAVDPCVNSEALGGTTC